MPLLKKPLFSIILAFILGSIAGWNLFNQNQVTAAAATPTSTAGDEINFTPAPDGRWTAAVNSTTGSLDLQGPDGQTVNIFPAGSTVNAVTWSPDSRKLLVVQTHWAFNEPEGTGVGVTGPIEIWQVELNDDGPGQPARLYQSPTPLEDGPQQIIFGHWSPDSRLVLFWEGILSASILADGLPLSVLDVTSGQVASVAELTLLNPRYQSWSPDSSRLVVTAGGYRSAQVDKWLMVWDAATGKSTPVISQTEQIPGIVAWSPTGEVIAYAAVPASETGAEWADLMTFDNPAIAGRRIYLLDPATGESRRLNEADTFQDGPLWSNDGAILYYGQHEDDQLVLMATDPATGQTETVPNAAIPLPEFIGYYGQWEQDFLLEYRFQEWKPGCP